MPRTAGLKPIEVTEKAHAAAKAMAGKQGRKLFAVASDAILSAAKPLKKSK